VHETTTQTFSGKWLSDLRDEKVLVHASLQNKGEGSQVVIPALPGAFSRVQLVDPSTVSMFVTAGIHDLNDDENVAMDVSVGFRCDVDRPGVRSDDPHVVCPNTRNHD